MILAWLKCAHQYPTQADHQKITRGMAANLEDDLLIHKRLAARQETEAPHPVAYAEMSGLERAQRAGEGVEPELLP
eukprot:1843033-Pyramimonas_sp.AAC.1